MWVPPDKFSALAGLVRKYEPTLKPGYMAAYGSVRPYECLSSGRSQSPAFGQLITPFCEALGRTVEMRVVLKIGWSIPHMEENPWLTYDDAQLTAADGSERRYKAKARQIALEIRMLQRFKIELSPR